MKEKEKILDFLNRAIMHANGIKHSPNPVGDAEKSRAELVIYAVKEAIALIEGDDGH